MARPRKSTASNETTITKERNTMAALTPDAITELLAGARTKGAGEQVLQDFHESKDAGWEIDLSSGAFAGKTAQQAYTTLVNAKKKTRVNDSGESVVMFPWAASIQVIKRKIGDDERVFVVDKNLVGA